MSDLKRREDELSIRKNELSALADTLRKRESQIAKKEDFLAEKEISLGVRFESLQLSPFLYSNNDENQSPSVTASPKNSTPTKYLHRKSLAHLVQNAASDSNRLNIASPRMGRMLRFPAGAT